MNDPVNHPAHYTQSDAGLECIEITEHLSFNLGCCLKYCWRFRDKNGLQDLEKSLWYLNREGERLQGAWFWQRWQSRRVLRRLQKLVIGKQLPFLAGMVLYALADDDWAEAYRAIERNIAIRKTNSSC